MLETLFLVLKWVKYTNKDKTCPVIQTITVAFVSFVNKLWNWLFKSGMGKQIMTHWIKKKLIATRNHVLLFSFWFLRSIIFFSTYLRRIPMCVSINRSFAWFFNFTVQLPYQSIQLFFFYFISFTTSESCTSKSFVSHGNITSWKKLSAKWKNEYFDLIIFLLFCFFFLKHSQNPFLLLLFL